MPKVILTQEAKEAERQRRMNNALLGAVGRYCEINHTNHKALAEKCGCSPSGFCKQLGKIDRMTINSIRRLSGIVEMTPEEWLQLGGFSKVP